MSRRARQTKANSSKRKQWTIEEARQTLAACDCSGMTMAAFCRKRGIKPKRLYWWKSRLAEWSDELELGAQPEPDDGHLVEAVVVTPTTMPGDAALKIHLCTGDRIDVASTAEVDADWLICLARGLRMDAAEGDPR